MNLCKLVTRHLNFFYTEIPKHQEGEPQRSERLKVLLIFLMLLISPIHRKYCARVTLPLHNTKISRTFNLFDL